MKKLRFFFLPLLCACFLSRKVEAQIYTEYGDGAYEFDFCTCEVSSEPLNNQPVDPYTMAADPDGNVYFVDIDQVFRIDAATGNVTQVASLPAGIPVSMVFGADGLLYLSIPGANGLPNEVLFSVDPNNGTMVNLGMLPTGFLFEGDLFFYQGQLYGLALNAAGLSVMLQVPVGNPGGTTVLHTFPTVGGMIGGISVFVDGVETVFVLAFDPATQQGGLYQVNMTTGALTLICAGAVYGGDLAAPPNYVVPPCCSNDAGNFQNLNLVQACANQSINLTHLGDEILNPDAALSFILTADSTADLPDGIIQILSTPTFNFDPATMDFGIPYFVAAVAAPSAAGSPDWSSNCIDLSFWAKIRWNAAPTVSFSLQNPTLCQGGCIEFTVNFTGTAPFGLGYENPFTGALQNQVFLEATGEILLCSPIATSLGDYNLQAVSLLDANCVCN